MTRTKAYFFTSTELSEESAWPLVFTDESGQVSEASQQCPISQLREIIGDCPLIIIVPDRLTSLHRVTLPLLSDKKAQAAIPYALEDYSAQEVSELHFSYSRKFYDNGQYLVLSCDKTWLQTLMNLLQQHQLEPKDITTPWFALSDNQCVLHNQSILCRSEAVEGAIPLSMWPMVQTQFTSVDEITILQFSKVSDILKELESKLISSEQTWESWVAEQLNRSAYISLNQGSFANKKEPASLKKSLWLIGTSLAIWLVIWLTTSLLSLHHTNSEIQQVDDKIAVIYRQFFPGAKQVISPRFRINQLLKTHGTGGESGLLRLLDQLGDPLHTNHITPVQLTYQNQRITLKLVANDFSQLEKFMNALKKQSVKAKQLDANRNEDKVEATVEMQL